jgi:hypothetical protein
MQKMFASAQEAKRKNIEQAFGMPHARFHILTSACCLWERHAMKTVIQKCVILHNLEINFEHQNGVNSDYINDDMYVLQHPFGVIPGEEGQTFDTRSRMISAMQNSELHTRLLHRAMAQIGPENSAGCGSGSMFESECHALLLGHHPWYQNLQSVEE